MTTSTPELTVFTANTLKYIVILTTSLLGIERETINNALRGWVKFLQDDILS